jgi:hypothetical protein
MTDSEYNRYVERVKYAVDNDLKEVLVGIYDEIRESDGEDSEDLRRIDSMYNTRWSGLV